MDAVARSRRLFLIALACAASAACERPPESPVGVSNAARPHGAAAADAGAPSAKRELVILPHDFRTRYAKLSFAPFVSMGHAAGRFQVEVYANDLAKELVARQNGEFPVGAVLVKEHWERGGGGGEATLKPGPVMAMEKMAHGFDADHGDWRYVVVSPEGDVLQDGKPDGCVLCHDDAPHDHVFVVR